MYNIFTATRLMGNQAQGMSLLGNKFCWKGLRENQLVGNKTGSTIFRSGEPISGRKTQPDCGHTVV